MGYISGRGARGDNIMSQDKNCLSCTKCDFHVRRDGEYSSMEMEAHICYQPAKKFRRPSTGTDQKTCSSCYMPTLKIDWKRLPGIDAMVCRSCAEGELQKHAHNHRKARDASENEDCWQEEQRQARHHAIKMAAARLDKRGATPPAGRCSQRLRHCHQAASRFSMLRNL